MSVLTFAKKMSIICCFPQCEWYGFSSELEEHFDICHPDNKIRMDSTSTCEIIIKEQKQYEPYLLCDRNELYWYSYKLGLFTIGESKHVEYYVNISILSPSGEIAEIRGPYATESNIQNYFVDNMEFDELNVMVYFGHNHQVTCNANELSKTFAQNCDCSAAEDQHTEMDEEFGDLNISCCYDNINSNALYMEEKIQMIFKELDRRNKLLRSVARMVLNEQALLKPK